MILRIALSLVLPGLLALSGCAHRAQRLAGDGERTLGHGASTAPAKPLEELQREFVDLRFGMFIHFGILTYTGFWSQANLDIGQFNPTGLDPGQWADAAVAAKMKYGVLTTRHHDGFALWPSSAGDFNVEHIPWRNGKGDVVAEYVAAFRSRGLLPGLYYSIWDNTARVASGQITPAKLAYIKTQLTELLSNYGPIPSLVMDGWSWQMGHNAVAYQEIRSLVKSLQPNCLLTDHTHLADPWDVDIVSFEEPKGAWAPAGNTYPGQQGQKVNADGGLVLGARHGRPHDRRGRGRPASRRLGTEVDQSSAQLPAQSRWHPGPRNRHTTA
jgi:alpha-L-fucosidase